MLIQSFRVRFLLWNVLLTGSVLAGFGVLTIGLAYRGGLARLDGDLQQNANREFREAHRSSFREGSPHLWRSAYGGGPEQVPMALLIRERESADVLLRSEAWPAGLSGADFADPPLSARALRRPPPRDDFEGPPGRRPPRPRDEAGMPHRPFGDRPPPPGEEADLPPLEKGPFTSLNLSDGDWRFGVIGQRNLTLIIGVSLQPLQTQMRQWIQVLLMAFVPGLFLIAISGWILTGRAMRPVRALTKAAEGITARGLDQRLPLTRESKEFSRLSEVFNRMLDRLEKSFQQATRFSADAAHELKTPLAILQGQLEESLRDAPDDPAHQQLCASLLEEVQRLKGIVRKLLLLSLADAGELRLHSEEVDLNTLVESAAEDAAILAPGLKLELQVPSAVSVSGDAGLLAQVIQNLVGNAIKYNSDAGWIRLELESKPHEVRLAVTNSGSPISADAQARIFERFYRGNASRTRTVEGVGLGLSLSRELARAHGGDLLLERSDESGTTFVLQLPI
jgi:two-component system, OmpR family, heavy metal sensor histidine kinase CusS